MPGLLQVDRLLFKGTLNVAAICTDACSELQHSCSLELFVELLEIVTGDLLPLYLLKPHQTGTSEQ